MDMSRIGKRLRTVRNRKNLTIKSLAELVQVVPATIQDIESGKTIPRPKTLLKICNALDVSPDVFLQDLNEQTRVFAIENLCNQLVKQPNITILKYVEEMIAEG